jgi:integrase-like protein
MTEQPVSPLRQRLIADMIVCNFMEKTRSDYVHHVKTLAAFLKRSPDTATPGDLRRFQLHQTETGARPPSINSSVSALRFFFTVTLDRPDIGHVLNVRILDAIGCKFYDTRHVWLLPCGHGIEWAGTVQTVLRAAHVADHVCLSRGSFTAYAFKNIET